MPGQNMSAVSGQLCVGSTVDFLWWPHCRDTAPSWLSYPQNDNTGHVISASDYKQVL